MRKDVRIVLAGDAGVGKSTLITSLIKEAYIAQVQKVFPEITLPAEVSPEGVVTKISDTSCEQGGSIAWTNHLLRPLLPQLRLTSARTWRASCEEPM